MLSLQSEINFLTIIVTIAVLITPGKKKDLPQCSNNSTEKKKNNVMVSKISFYSFIVAVLFLNSDP